MKIIELTEIQFKNYAKLHSSRNYLQTIEFAKTKPDHQRLLLGFANEEDNTIMGACLILTKIIGKFNIGLVPGGFLIDYDNDTLFKDFITILKDYLKQKKYVYLAVDNVVTYKMYDKNKEVIYFDTNIIKLLDELGFVKSSKEIKRKVVLETEKTPNETYQMFNSNTRRNIDLALKRAITIYQDESNNIDTLLKLNNGKNAKHIKSLLDNFNSKDNKAEIYLAKIDPEKYVNNYRFLLDKEEDKNALLNDKMQNMSIKKSTSLINKKMYSDKMITKYHNEVIKATNMYTKYPNDIIIGAILIIKNNREIYFLDEAYNSDLAPFYSSHLIKWEIIKKYLSLGYRIFNFGYIKNMDQKDGNYLFKMGFGGKVYESVGTYDLVINKWAYRLTKLLYRLIK